MKEVRAFGAPVTINDKTVAVLSKGTNGAEAKTLSGKLVKYNGIPAAIKAGETFIFTNPKTGNWTRSKNMPNSGQAIVTAYIKNFTTTKVVEEKKAENQ